MAQRDEDRFRLRPGPPRSRRDAKAFLSRVVAELNRAGYVSPGGSTPRSLRSPRGRGHVAARMGRSLGTRARRVVVKARLVQLKVAGADGVASHIRYITRDGVAVDAESASAYNAVDNAVDKAAFQSRASQDRHQFRFIVAPEDAEQIQDLRGFTRELMHRMETDVGTRLDWIAVDHWNTDNPHTHIVLRGKDDVDRDLVIARGYIGHGMRERAAQIATEWLGPRTELELRANREREIRQERWTELDRSLARYARNSRIDVNGALFSQGRGADRSTLVGRLHHLAAMGLAKEFESGSWQLHHNVERVLRQLGKRGDVIRTMQRTFANERREFSIFDSGGERAIVGRVSAKGIDGELREQTYVVVDGIDGRAHYVPLSNAMGLKHLPIGAIVEARGIVEPRGADRNIAAIAKNGIYRVGDHLAALSSRPDHISDARAIVQAHVRRLEALRRRGIVERKEEGVWHIPSDLPARGLLYDRQRNHGAVITVHSHLPIAEQTSALGATWLDRQLANGAGGIASRGFGLDVRHALTERESFLVKHGFAQRRAQQTVLARNLLSDLQQREVAATAKRIAEESGLIYRDAADATVEGTYRRTISLASGRFVMLDDGLGFNLVPWRPVIEKRLGQHLVATTRGVHVDWKVGSRARGVS